MNRYTLFSQMHDEAYIGEHPEGDYVRYEDVAVLRAQVHELQHRRIECQACGETAVTTPYAEIAMVVWRKRGTDLGVFGPGAPIETAPDAPAERGLTDARFRAACEAIREARTVWKRYGGTSDYIRAIDAALKGAGL